MPDVTVYLRNDLDPEGQVVGSLPLAAFGDRSFDPVDAIGTWGVDVANVGLADTSWLSGRFFYEPSGRGAGFEVVISAPDTETA